MRHPIWGNIKKARHFIRSVFDRVENGFLNGAMLALFAMMVLTTGNAVGRYLYNEPIPGTYEFTELYLMPMAIFLTAAHLQNAGGNINVDILYDRLPEVARTVIDLVGRVLALVIFGMIAYKAGDQFWIGLLRGRSSVGVVEFPLYVSWLIMAVGLLVLAIRLFFQISSDVGELWGRASSEAAEEGEG